MIAHRLNAIAPFHAMALLARARELEAQGRSVVHMEIGEPDFATPQAVVDAGINALRQGKTHYTPAVGLPELREAIADYYLSQFQAKIDPRRVVVTPGASGALQLILAMLVNPGSQVLMADPGYPCNRNLVFLFEGEPVMVPVEAQHHYQLSTELLQHYWSDRTSCVMVASPSNPTGTVISRDRLEALLQTVRDRGGHLIVDEIYQSLWYEEVPETALTLGEDVFVINSFSKYFGMTGWRLGWLVAPEDAVDQLDKLAQNLFLSAPTPAQHAALAAFQPETQAILEQRRQEFQRRRDFLLPALRRLGFDISVEPQGAFYLYADCSRLTQDSFAFATELLENAGVAITPGIDFGRHKATRHVRFAYTTSMQQLQLGIERIAEFIGQ
jgi:aspartate/methionine/tyrosine aminotransferase